MGRPVADDTLLPSPHAHIPGDIFWGACQTPLPSLDLSLPGPCGGKATTATFAYVLWPEARAE